METISLESTPAINTFSFKSALSLLLQWIGAFIAFILSMIALGEIEDMVDAIRFVW